MKFNDPSYTVVSHLAHIKSNFTADELPTWGYGAKLSPTQLHAVRQDPKVKYVEDNVPIYWADDIPAEEDSTHDSHLIDPSEMTELDARKVHYNAGWGLAYLSENYSTPIEMDYFFHEDAGRGVDIYTLDTGIAHVGSISLYLRRFINLTKEPWGQGGRHGTA